MRKSQLSLLNNGYDPSPHTGHPGLCLGDIQTWSGVVTGGGCDWSISVPLSPPPALSPGLEGFPGLGKSSCGLGSSQAWLPSIPRELQVGTGSCRFTPKTLLLIT